MKDTWANQVAKELKISQAGTLAVINMNEEGATVPFIARYRKEVTGGLDEVQIRDILTRFAYLKELSERKATILKSIEEQGKLNDALRKKIELCEQKSLLEDLYLPFKPKRRTRAMIAIERGLKPLSMAILNPPSEKPETLAAPFVNLEKEVPDIEMALKGARDIVAEEISENAQVRQNVRALFWSAGEIESQVSKKFEGQKTKFDSYIDHKETLKGAPSHRFLAMRRGEREGVLKLKVQVPQERAEQCLDDVFPSVEPAWDLHLKRAKEDALERLLFVSMETDVRVEAKLKADEEAVSVFANNLEHLLMAAPLGEEKVFGVDPGLRTGCKVAVLDSTGKYIETITIYPHSGADRNLKAKTDLAALVKKHQPRAIGVGNGTAGRETEHFVREVLKDADIKETMTVSVNESGASIYSASDIAREEFPELDLTIRGAISIGRRLQDPLSELVKVEPKSIGVGQYQHDVHQPLLQKQLSDVVESCVNKVGVDLNLASAPLLAQVSGISKSVAKRIVEYRNEHGAFRDRHHLLLVPGLGPKAYEQAAGFLRIRKGDHSLDASAVHPERYALVEKMCADIGIEMNALVGNPAASDKIQLQNYINEDENLGLPTLKDIVDELKKPGRDPRETFAPPKFRDDVNAISDLKLGMKLEGVVTNVTKFGAFVDVGVHQDGLVHISRLASSFVKDPADVVKPGQKIQVWVIEVDVERKRISFSALDPEAASAQNTTTRPKKAAGPKTHAGNKSKPKPSQTRNARSKNKGRSGFSNNPFAGLLK